MHRFSAFAAVGLLAACGHSAPATIPIGAAPADLAVLEGEWQGEYHADNSGGREGTILFRLEAGEEEATGDVLMHVEGRDAVDALPPVGSPWAHVSRDRILFVTFVRSSGGTVFGKMDPYPDPVCGCEIHTTFTGRIDGDVIAGTYTSTHVEGGARTSGQWRVRRK